MLCEYILYTGDNSDRRICLFCFISSTQVRALVNFYLSAKHEDPAVAVTLVQDSIAWCKVRMYQKRGKKIVSINAQTWPWTLWWMHDYLCNNLEKKLQEEKRTFLRQALEARLIALYLDIKNYTQVYSTICES